LYPNYAAHTACAFVPDWFAFAANPSDSAVFAISAVSTCTIATEIPLTSDTTADREITNILAYGVLS
jgi:hypothetical protein